MKPRFIVLALVALFATSAATASAQMQTGEIFGKVTDQTGAVLPGVTVTLTSPILLQPLTAVTSETGTYQFPRLEIGAYSVKFELAGFKTVVKEDIRVTIGFSAGVNTQMGISTVQETITVTGATPVVDTKETGTKQTFTNELLQGIPSARDPWVILQQTAGIAMDRENIGGNMSGQQSNYVSRGGNTTNNKWSLDGVDITDMSATGASPSYYDFDAFEEITINTGGVDVTQQTGGVGINLVTKSGSDKFRGSSRFYDTNDRFEAQNVTDAMRTQGATSGNPIQDVKDYGFELGGPIKKGKAWIWGAFGKQNIKVGVLNFYQPTAACAAVKSAPLTFPIDQVNNCLNTDLTVLTATNVKAEVQLFKGNKLSLFNNMAKKDRNARGADDLHPIETTSVQAYVPASFGTKWWITGPNPTYKAGDQWVVSDRLLLDVQWAHVGNNFVLDFHEPGLATVQPTLIVSTGLNGRSGAQSVFLRPVNSLNFNANYFLPGTFGGDHSLRVGAAWRDSNTSSFSHTGGYGTIRFPNSASNDCTLAATGCQVDLTRDGLSIYDLTDLSAFVQDTITHKQLTVQAGIRWDRNHDQALAASIGANPLSTQWLPAINFPGTDPKVIFNNISPRVGFTYDMTGDGKTLVRANYARYFGQVGNGGVAGTVNPVGSTTLRYPWVDANNNLIAEANEITTGPNPLSASTNWSAANPANTVSANAVDPKLKNDTTDEVIIGFDREVGSGFAVGGAYIWRRYGNFQWSDRQGLLSSDYSAVSFTPAASACPSAKNADCQAVTYFQPNFQIPTIVTLTNVPDYNRSFNGVEVTGRKRLANHWQMNTSFAYNSTLVNFNSFPGSIISTTASTIVEDPTNHDKRNGFQYDYPTSGSGIGNVYINAKWLFKLSGMYQAPFGVNVSAFYNARQGYPFERFVQSPSRANGAGVVSVLLDQVGNSRLPNFQNFDFHVDRAVKFGTVRLLPSIDVFNVTNNNTIQAIRGTQNASNANDIQAIVAPRVVRFGVRVQW